MIKVKEKKVFAKKKRRKECGVPTQEGDRFIARWLQLSPCG